MGSLVMETLTVLLNGNSNNASECQALTRHFCLCFPLSFLADFTLTNSFFQFARFILLGAWLHKGHWKMRL